MSWVKNYGVIRAMGTYSSKREGEKRLKSVALPHEHYVAALDTGDWLIGLILTTHIDLDAATDFCRMLNDGPSNYLYFVEEV